MKTAINELYRIFYYDCPPTAKRIFHPFLQKQVDLSKSDLYVWMNQFLNELKKKRKFALRLGKLAEEQAHYTIRPKIVKKLCNGKLAFSDLTETDFYIILISGDSDFVSAAKLARREGIDFILDPLGAPIKPDLFEHIDGLRTCDRAYTQNATTN